LGAVLQSKLGGFGRALNSSVQPAPVAPPDGARWEEHVYAGPAGTRPYKLYVPSTSRGQALPLVVMLHGCTQSPDDFAAAPG
jgi:poly(3-hydroxybutyrate) depolymerase